MTDTPESMPQWFVRWRRRATAAFVILGLAVGFGIGRIEEQQRDQRHAQAALAAAQRALTAEITARRADSCASRVAIYKSQVDTVDFVAEQLNATPARLAEALKALTKRIGDQPTCP